ncbi:hypothetical protein BDZ90DRAFT_85297 [Jaminaea rosea]|uniref:Exoribonuclease phosphorolytic domain-containing protein n=1 Tax=Jaminaea rosea TaxID=1569628 RepID=A0A316UJY6_9BASI|nr:hypothetical protein BDZ90DRAFT_85297 [Jaminaea rosea]PWN25244.1 hypothetical protein BDZ90DRAFT_85297 [Jaminaea rosea]
MSSQASSSRAQPRTYNALRPLNISHGVLPLSHSTGSTSFSLGHSQSSLASVQGPIEVRIRDELTDQATLQCTAIPLRGQQGVAANSFAVGTLQKALSSVVLLHRYPRSLIQVTVQTTDEAKASTPLGWDRAQSSAGRKSIRPRRPHPDASWTMAERATSVNAAGLALIQAGISCSATICAVSVAVVPRKVARLTRKGKGRATAASGAMDEDGSDSEDGNEAAQIILVDPDTFEEEQAASVHLFAFAMAGQVVSCDDGQLKGEPEARLILVESEGGKVDSRLVSSAAATSKRGALQPLIISRIASSPSLQYLEAIRRARSAAVGKIHPAIRQSFDEQLLGSGKQGDADGDVVM